jgi:hypothetical protein
MRKGIIIVNDVEFSCLKEDKHLRLKGIEGRFMILDMLEH